MTWLRGSALPYLSSLVVTLMLAAWVNYLIPLVHPEGITVKGQSMAIVIPFVAFPITLVLWLLYRGGRSRSPWFIGFIAAMSAAWLIHMLLIWGHGDLYPHVVWLFVPILLMVLLKAPTAAEAWLSLVVFGWSAAVVLVTTRIAEIVGAIPMFYIPPDIITWELSRYWLPLSGYLGLEGRWPGPFGFNSKTGFVCVVLILIALSRWRRWSSPVFLVVGVLGVLLTGGRGSLLSLFAGLVVLGLFATRGPILRIPTGMRVPIGVTLVLGMGAVFLLTGVGSTGRSSEIWPAFLDQWRLSPWVGVGQSGLDQAGGQVAISMEAHSLYIEELAKFGILGLVTQYAAIGIGLTVAVIAAVRARAGALSIMAAFFVASATEIFTNGWQSHSIYSIMLVLCVAYASASVAEPAPLDSGSADSEQGADGLTLEARQEI